MNLIHIIIMIKNRFMIIRSHLIQTDYIICVACVLSEQKY